MTPDVAKLRRMFADKDEEIATLVDRVVTTEDERDALRLRAERAEAACVVYRRHVDATELALLGDNPGQSLLDEIGRLRDDVRKLKAQQLEIESCRNGVLTDRAKELEAAMTPIVNHYRECVAAGSRPAMGMILTPALLLGKAEAALAGKEKS